MSKFFFIVQISSTSSKATFSLCITNGKEMDRAPTGLSKSPSISRLFQAMFPFQAFGCTPLLSSERGNVCLLRKSGLILRFYLIDTECLLCAFCVIVSYLISSKLVPSNSSYLFSRKKSNSHVSLIASPVVYVYCVSIPNFALAHGSNTYQVSCIAHARSSHSTSLRFPLPTPHHSPSLF